MNIDIKYNKTALRDFQNKMKVRKNALPTLKNKEAALRAMVFETRDQLQKAEAEYRAVTQQIAPWKEMWNEFDPRLLEVKEVKTTISKVAGIQIPVFEKMEVEVVEFATTAYPDWFADGVEAMKRLLEANIKYKLLKKRLDLLEYARKKATQKVNLYEKVQIPSLESAIRQIKRYLEDEDNLSKAGQKLLKSKIQRKAVS